MQPRILLRTHYEADEPRLIIAAVTRSSDARQSRSEERIASTLKSWARNNGYTISTPGAVYAVDNARHLGLLDKSNRRTALGLAFAFADSVLRSERGSNSRSLSPVEERLYLKTYLAGAGALLVKFGKWLLDRGSTTSGQLRDDSVIERLMIEALNDYLGLATEIRDRTAIRRERERLAREDYSSATKRHKRYPLLTTMLRLRLLRGNEEGSDVLEPIQPDVNGRLASVSRTLPSIEALERLIRAEKLQETLDVEMREYDRNDLPSGQDPTALLAKAYAFSMDSGMQACPLSYLDDVLLSAFPASPQRAPLSAERMVEPIHRAKPSEVRFHVDRRGRRAFVLFSEGALREFQTTHG